MFPAPRSPIPVRSLSPWAPETSGHGIGHSSNGGLCCRTATVLEPTPDPNSHRSAHFSHGSATGGFKRTARKPASGRQAQGVRRHLSLPFAVGIRLHTYLHLPWSREWIRPQHCLNITCIALSALGAARCRPATTSGAPATPLLSCVGDRRPFGAYGPSGHAGRRCCKCWEHLNGGNISSASGIWSPCRP